MTNVGPARSWRCYFLSTSNFTLDGLAQRGGVALDDAQRSRLTDVRLPSGGRESMKICMASCREPN